MVDYFLQLKNISINFNGTQILNHIDLDIQPGKIYGLVGENGAGKSVLVNIISGVFKPDAGEIWVNGALQSGLNPKMTANLKISTLHQDLNLIENISVAENIFFGHYSKKNKLYERISWKVVYKKSQYYLNALGFNINPKQIVSKLSPGEKRIVEIARALSRESRLVVLDEPNALLSIFEMKEFNRILRHLKGMGISVIYVSHRLQDIIALCDQIFVLHGGKIAAKIDNVGISEDTIINYMTDMQGVRKYPKLPHHIGRVILRVDAISTENNIKNISFRLRKGEVLGIFGMLNSGRTAVARALFGLDKLTGGSIFINEMKMNFKNPHDAIRNKIGYLPQDAVHDNLVEIFSLAENITISNIKAVQLFGVLMHKKENAIAQEFIRKLFINTPGLSTNIMDLSSGSKQKIALCRWIFSETNILILDEPTRGLDNHTKIEIYNVMNNYVQNNQSIIFVSSDVNELMGMCDHILVMYDGQIVKEIPRNAFSQEKAIYYAMGKKD